MTKAEWTIRRVSQLRKLCLSLREAKRQARAARKAPPAPRRHARDTRPS